MRTNLVNKMSKRTNPKVINGGIVKKFKREPEKSLEESETQDEEFAFTVAKQSQEDDEESPFHVPHQSQEDDQESPFCVAHQSQEDDEESPFHVAHQSQGGDQESKDSKNDEIP